MDNGKNTSLIRDCRGCDHNANENPLILCLPQFVYVVTLPLHLSYGHASDSYDARIVSEGNIKEDLTLLMFITQYSLDHTNRSPVAIGHIHPRCRARLSARRNP